MAAKAKSNPKELYAYVRTKLKTRDSIADLLEGDQMVNSNGYKENVLNDFFSSVFTDEDVTQIPNCTKSFSD